MWRTVLVAVGLTLAVGCVPKARYEEVQNQLDQCRERNQKFRAAAERRTAAHEALMAELKPLIEKGMLAVEIVDGRTVIGMKSEVLFESGSAKLSESGKSTVSELARALARRTDEEWQVEGHTDDEKISTPEFPSNWHLGAARALNVVLAMVDAGMPASRVSAATFGEHAPAQPNTSEAGKKANRRIEIVLLPDLADMPGYGEMMGKGGRKKRPGQGGGGGR